MVTVRSALRFAWTTQGVTQAVGLSSPEISAVAPAGVVAMEIFSVVPRVTDAQPRHGNTIAAAKSSLIIDRSPIRGNFSRNLNVKARDARYHVRVSLTAPPCVDFTVPAAAPILSQRTRGHFLSSSMA
jgi:hypothetical protein